jgi:predicted transglutaminase-like cysteine proteinase
LRQQHRHTHGFFLSALIAVLLAGLIPARAEGLFHTRELFSTDLAPFKKWDIVVERAAQEQNTASSCQASTRDCPAAEWQSLIAELRALPLRARVERANEVLNQRPYVTSEANWHDPNHWETPYEFLARGGQCEDYAIAKFMALAASGVPERDLRLVVVRDMVKFLDHAILVVYVDGEPLVLDNQVRDVTPAARVDRYVPYYSINRTGWWYHQHDNATNSRFASAAGLR